MPESRDGESQMDGWAQALDAARPVRVEHSADWSRRRLGVVALVIALIWPFYAHWVERLLLRAELQWAQERVAAESNALMQQAREASAAAGQQAEQARERAAQLALQARVAAVRVVGAIDGNSPIVILDHLAPEGAAESAGTICAQAERWLRRSLRGATLRVRRSAGSLPASDAGLVICD